MPRTGTTGIVVSIIFFGLGAIMAFAVTDIISGVDSIMAGYIVMGLAALGFIVSLGGFLSTRTESKTTNNDPVIEEKVTRLH